MDFLKIIALEVITVDIENPRAGLQWKYPTLLKDQHELRFILESLAKNHYRELFKKRITIYKNISAFEKEYMKYIVAMHYL